MDIRPCQRCLAVAGVDLPVAEEMKVLGLEVMLDRRLTFSKHVSIRGGTIAFNYHFRTGNPSHSTFADDGPCWRVV